MLGIFAILLGSAAAVVGQPLAVVNSPVLEVPCPATGLPCGTVRAAGGVALDAERGVLYIGDAGDLTVIDALQGRAVREFPLPAFAADVAVDPATHRVLATAGGGVVALDPEGREAFRVPIADGAGGLALDPALRRGYTLSATQAVAFDLDGGAILAAGTVGPGATRLAVHPGSHRLAVAHRTGDLTLLSPSLAVSVVVHLGPGHAIVDVAADPARNLVYASNLAPRAIVLVNATTGAVEGRVDVPVIGAGDFPWSVAVDPATDRLYAVHQQGHLSAFRLADGAAVYHEPTGGIDARFAAVHAGLRRVFVSAAAGDPLAGVLDTAGAAVRIVHELG